MSEEAGEMKTTQWLSETIDMVRRLADRSTHERVMAMMAEIFSIMDEREKQYKH